MRGTKMQEKIKISMAALAALMLAILAVNLAMGATTVVVNIPDTAANTLATEQVNPDDSIEISPD
jgi:cell division protein FtsL